MSEAPQPITVERDDPAPGMTWTVGIIGAILLVVAVAVVILIYRAVSHDQRMAKQISPAPRELTMLRAEQEARLGAEAHWEIRTEGERSLVIPIEQAMETVVEEAHNGGTQR